MSRTALYRHFDAHGRLLYVGISCDLAARDKAHARGSDWRNLVARTGTQWFADRREAEEAERKAIATETPLHNRTWAAKSTGTKSVVIGSFQAAFADHIKAHGTSIKEIVDATGVSRDVINKLRARPGSSTTVENAVLIASYFGKSVNDFIAVPIETGGV